MPRTRQKSHVPSTSDESVDGEGLPSSSESSSYGTGGRGDGRSSGSVSARQTRSRVTRQSQVPRGAKRQAVVRATRQARAVRGRVMRKDSHSSAVSSSSSSYTGKDEVSEQPVNRKRPRPHTTRSRRSERELDDESGSGDKGNTDANGMKQLPSTAFRYSLAQVITEKHRSPIFTVKFNDSPLARHRDVFASVGERQATVYRISEDRNANTGRIQYSTQLMQSYYDEDAEEQFFTCCWTDDDETGLPILCVAGHRGVIRVLDCQGRSVRTTLLGHGGAINELRSHPTKSHLILSAAKDESARLWNWYTGVCVLVFAGEGGHRDDVLSVDFHLSGDRIATCGHDTSVKVWSLSTPELTDHIAASEHAGYENLKLRKKPFRARLVQLPLMDVKIHFGYADCVRWYGDLILSKSVDNRILLWQPKKADVPGEKDWGSLITEYVFKDCDVWYVRFDVSLRHQALVVGNMEGKVFIWRLDKPTPKLAAQLSHHSCRNVVRSCSFSSDCATLVTSTDDGSIFRWQRPQPKTGKSQRGWVMEEYSSDEEDGADSGDKKREAPTSQVTGRVTRNRDRELRQRGEHSGSAEASQ